MISFKQYLQEKALNPSTFDKTLERLGDQAKLGFELEVWVPPESDLFAGEGEAPSISVNDIEDYDEWRSLFSLTKHTAAMADEFDDWTSDVPRGGDSSWKKFVSDVFKNGSGLVDAFDLKPIFGWADDDNTEVYTTSLKAGASGSYKHTADNTAEALSDDLGVKIKVEDWDSDISGWTIVRDSSIASTDESPGVGLEIVSPPLPAQDALDDLNNCFRFFTRHKFETNDSTGLHLNLSIPDLKEKLDPLKMILFLGETHLLKSYDREANMYTKSHVSELIDSIQKNGSIPKSFSELKTIGWAALTDEKYRTVNLSKLKSGYLEFRIAGNANYHKKLKQVTSDVGRFLTVLELACDPDAEKKEYAKKLTKLFNTKSDKEQEDNSVSDLKNFLKNNLGAMSTGLLLSAAKASEGNHAEILQGALVRLGKKITEKDMEIPLKTIAEFKVFLRKLEKQVPTVLKDAKALARDQDESDYMKAFLKAFNIK